MTIPMSVTPADKAPFQLENSKHDPIGTIREERLDERTNVWVLEEIFYDSVRRTRRWRCMYTTDESATGLFGRTIRRQRAAGWPVIGAVSGTPADRAWREHCFAQD